MTAVLAPHAAQAAADAGGIHVDTLTTAVAIALDGGPDQTAPDWLQWRSCNAPTAEYFDGANNTAGKELLRRCRDDCAVQAECLAAALGTGEHEGIWGGTHRAGRRRIRNALREAGLLGVVGEEAYIAWRDPAADREPVAPQPRPAITTPWPHQGRAVQAIVDELTDGGSCQISMATASGKTHVSIWAAHDLGARRVLILVPSLSLITQTAAAWAADPRWADARMLAVCGDAGLEDLERTTDPQTVRWHAAGDGPIVVLATYQSSEVLVDANVRFDLTVADEAHHLAGDADKHYASILRGEIRSDRTLYMTATPRRYTRRRTTDADVALVSMDDDGPFGRRVFTFSLSDAVAAGVVADYRVIVAAVERDTFDRVAAHPELVDVDPHLLAGAIAVVEAIGQQHLTSCVSFHTRVERARTFSRLVGQVAELLPDIRPAGPGWAGFVHGQANVRIRERLLARLADTHTWGVLANARALGEGVDLPALDAVAIVDPRNSETDVLQATGRALRLSGDKVGTVLLPVLLARDSDPDDPMSGIDERSLDVVSGVLRALRAHDQDLGARLDYTRRDVARRDIDATNRGLVRAELGQLLRKRAARGLLRSRVELRLPGGALGDLAGALALHVVRESTSSWDEAYARLEAWTEHHGHCRITQSTDVGFTAGANTTLGSWCSQQRQLYRRGLLPADRVELLARLTGWMWDGRADAWYEKLEVLRDYVESHGRYPQGREEWRGYKIGSFVNTCRTAMTTKDNEWLLQFPDRIAAIEALPGWVWNARDAGWEQHYEDLTVWVGEHGHAHPSQGDCAPDGFDLGKWTAKQRICIRQGKRTPEQIERLRALPGWVEDFRAVADQLWEDGFERTRRYMATHGELVPQLYVEPDGYKLGSWNLKQRQMRLHPGNGRGALTDAQEQRLEAIPGWTWTPKADGWRRHYDALSAVAPSRLTDDGILSVPRDRVDGIDVGAWVVWQRKYYRAGTLSADRIALIEQIPGWRWDPPSGGHLSAAGRRADAPTDSHRSTCTDCGLHHATVAEAFACDDQTTGAA